MKISWYDSRSIKINVSEQARNFVDDVTSKGNGKTYLESDIRASHSGQLITGRCYTGWGMKAGVGSWFDMANGGSAAFNKPVIVNHDISSDPLGRIVNAKFTQLKEGDEWFSDWKNPDEGAGKFGSGYTTLVTHTFDKEAIEKILDGRYSTVSTRQTTDQAWCSCGASFKTGCDHIPDSYYEGEDGNEYLAYVVTGVLEGIEVSWVNHPRQPNAKVLSSRKLKDLLQDSNDNPNGVILIGEAFCDQAEEITSYLKGVNSEITINLADENMPSPSVFTGRTQVSMAKINGASPNSNLEGLDEESTKTETTVDTEGNEDSSPNKEENKEDKSLKDDESFDFAFSNLCRAWKDSLDLEQDFKDSYFAMGITDKADGHAHVFDMWLNSKEKVGSGETYGTGQGKTKHPHRHSIWVDGIDLNLSEFKGETRDASAGPSHTHSFTSSMSDSETSRVTLIASVQDIKDAIKQLDDRVNEDTLSSEYADSLLDSEEAKIEWDDSYYKAATKLLARLESSKRKKIISDMLASGLFEEEDEGHNSMDKNTVEKLLNDLLKDKEKLSAQVTELTGLVDSKESERQTLLDENVALKASVLSLKATLVVDARSKISGETLEDEARKTQIEDLASKEEKELDGLIDSEVIGNIRKEVVEVKETNDANASVKSGVADGAPIPAVSDSPDLPKKKVDAKDKKENRDDKSFETLLEVTDSE